MSIFDQPRTLKHKCAVSGCTDPAEVRVQVSIIKDLKGRTRKGNAIMRSKQYCLSHGESEFLDILKTLGREV